jgi:lipopolysaccharide biosynthesis regulator YciM
MFYNRAIEVNPESHRANSSMGDILTSSGKLKEAIDHYKKALSVRIDLADTFAKLCKAKLTCCDWDQQDECYNHLFSLVSKQMEAGELPCVDPFTIFMYH